MSRVCPIVTLLLALGFTTLTRAQTETPAADETKSEYANSPVYPRAIALDGSTAYVVDLDLPGIWRIAEGKRTLFHRGSNLLRKPINRPFSVAIHPGGGILVGDSATREIYHVTGNADPVPLNGGYLGIPMAIAVSPDGKMVYVGDAEKRATFKFPIEGVTEGETPELVARVNARGLQFDTEGNFLYAVTPNAEAIRRIDVASGDVKDIVTGRPFEFPNDLAWAGDHGFVTDIYGNSIFRFTADGESELWHQGDPLVGPVGIAVDDDTVYVVDPKVQKVFTFDRTSKEVGELEGF